MNGNDVRPFFVHLRAEHRMIRAALAQLETALEKHTRDVCHCTQDLRAALDHHFCEEEKDGCTDEAVARNPALAREATELCHEHNELLQTADRLIQTVGAEQWSQLFAAFKKQVELHLEKEAHLLEIGLNADQDLESFH